MTGKSWHEFTVKGRWINWFIIALLIVECNKNVQLKNVWAQWVSLSNPLLA
jgi:hypothetical protein